MQARLLMFASFAAIATGCGGAGGSSQSDAGPPENGSLPNQRAFITYMDVNSNITTFRGQGADLPPDGGTLSAYYDTNPVTTAPSANGMGSVFSIAQAAGVAGTCEYRIRDASGDLRVDMAAGSLSLKLPLVYQDGAGGRQRIDALYELRAGNQVGFHLAAYDKSRPLVIDPTLVYASYFGNSLAVQAMAVDGAGNVYIGGYTSASNPLPTVNALQPGNARNNDAFVTKFDTTGKTVL